MFYKCTDCSKIINGYIEKCPDCGCKIELTDSITDSEARNLQNAEVGEGMFELFKKRVRNGYIATAIYMIVTVTVMIVVGVAFDLPGELFVALEPVLLVVLAVILIVIYKKFHLFSCPHCDHMMRGYNALYSQYCPYCGKRIRE